MKVYGAGAKSAVQRKEHAKKKWQEEALVENQQ